MLENHQTSCYDFGTQTGDGCVDDHKWPGFAGPRLAGKAHLQAGNIPNAVASYADAALFPGSDIATGEPGHAEAIKSIALAHAGSGSIFDPSSSLPGWLNDLDEFVGAPDVPGTLCDLLGSWVGASIECSITSSDSGAWVVAYRPVNWRFLKKEIQNDPPTVAQTQDYYPRPLGLEETRMRGARTFCAMRETAIAQGKYGLSSMGSQSLDPSGSAGMFLLFNAGESVAAVSVAAPVKLTNSASANAFAVPIAMRSQISPLSGILVPTMPERSTPVMWITGDAEVLSDEDPKDRVFSSGAQPQYVDTKKYVNGQHSDLFIGEQSSGGVHVHLTAPLWGPFVVADVSIDYTFENGKLVPGIGAYLADKWGFDKDWTVAGDGRGLTLFNLTRQPFPRLFYTDYYEPTSQIYFPWTSKLAGPGVSAVEQYLLASDAPMFPYQGRFVPIEASANGLVAAGQFSSGLGIGTLTRMVNADDRSISVMDRSQQHLALGVDVGFALGPLGVGIKGQSKVDADVRQFFTIRDHASLVGESRLRPDPLGVATGLNPANGGDRYMQTNAVVIPELRSNITSDALKISAYFDLNLNTPFGPIHVNWNKPFIEGILSNSASIAEKILPEQDRLRVGEYSDYGVEFDNVAASLNVPTFRATYSHLPQPGVSLANGEFPQSYESFPLTSTPVSESRQDVGRCLAANPPVPPPPDWHKGTQGDPSEGATCIYGLVGAAGDTSVFDLPDLPGSICLPGNIQTYLQSISANYGQIASPDVLKCLEDMINFLCVGYPAKAHVQPYPPGSPTPTIPAVISRFFDISPDASMQSPDQQDLTQINQECYDAFLAFASTETEAEQYAEFVGENIVPGFHQCRASDASLY